MAICKGTQTRQLSRSIPALLAGDLDRLNDHIVSARRSILTAMDRHPDAIELTAAFDSLGTALELLDKEAS